MGRSSIDAPNAARNDLRLLLEDQLHLILSWLRAGLEHGEPRGLTDADGRIGPGPPLRQIDDLPFAQLLVEERHDSLRGRVDRPERAERSEIADVVDRHRGLEIAASL